MKRFVKGLIRLIRTILSFFLETLLHLHLSEENWDNLMQFVKFCLVGVTNTVIGYIIYIVVVFLLSPLHVSWDYIAGNLMEYLLSVLWSFMLNDKLVFTLKTGERRSPLRALLKSYATYGFTGIVLNNALGYLWIVQLGISKYVAPIISLMVSIPINFLLSKLWAFRAIKRSTEKTEDREGRE